MKFLTIFTSLIFTLFLFSCNERKPIGRAADAKYLEDGSNRGLVNLDKINAQDFTRAANQLVVDLLASGSLSEAPNQPAILHVGEIRNDTQTYFDTDLLLQGMKRDLLASKKVRISTTAGPEGKYLILMPIPSARNLELVEISRYPHLGPTFLFPERLLRKLLGRQGDSERFLLSAHPDRTKWRYSVWFGRELITKQGRRGAIGF